MAFPLQYIHLYNKVTIKNVQELSELVQRGVKTIPEFTPPTPDDTQKLASKLGGSLTIDISDEQVMVKTVTNVLNCSSLVSRTICDNLYNELLMISNNSTIARNGLIKVLHWLHKTLVETHIEVVDHVKGETVLYKGKIGTYELYTLYILSKLGIEIYAISKESETLDIKKYNNINLNIDKENPEVEISSNRVKASSTIADAETQFEQMIAGKSQYKNIIVYGCNGDIGKKELNPFLENLEKRFGDPNNTEKVMILHSGFTTPTYDGMKDIQRGIGDNTKRVVNTCLVNNLVNEIGMQKCSELTTLYEKLCSNISSAGQLNNKLMIQCKYLKVFLKNNTNFVIFYGMISDEVVNLILACNKLDIKFFVACTEKHESVKLNILENSDIHEFEGSVPIYPYPLPSNRVNTLAYQAYQELGETLFNGETPGMYRDFQFKTCKNVPMRLIYEDIISMWKVDNQFRPGFSSSETAVNIPNIFGIINGCKESKDEYCKTIGSFVTSHTILYKNPSILNMDTVKESGMMFNHGASVNRVRFEDQKPVISNGKLNINILRAYPNFSYKYIREDAQLNMLSKIQDILDMVNLDKSIENGFKSLNKYYDLVLNICMNLPQNIQQMVQWYDFTKEVPKIILVHDKASDIGVETTIFLNYLYLLGFDILIFVPTGYRVTNYLADEPNANIQTPTNSIGEAVIKQKKCCVYHRINIGSPAFDIEVDYNDIMRYAGNDEKQSTKSNKGFFKKLFG